MDEKMDGKMKFFKPQSKEKKVIEKILDYKSKLVPCYKLLLFGIALRNGSLRTSGVLF